MNDILLNLFDSLNSQVDVRSKFVTAKHSETIHIEFKEKSDTRVPDLASPDKKNFAKCMSAFSNADGGILIWGVKTSKLNGKDCATVLKPIRQVEEFAERLRSCLIDLIIPQNQGVRIEAITNRVGNGYVKCYIPPSDHAPHRSMGEDREYWLRLDGRTAKMEHYQIRDMMLRHAHPSLDFSYAISSEGVYSSEPLPDGQVTVTFGIQNNGRTLAKHVGLVSDVTNATVVEVRELRDVSAVNPGKTLLTWNSDAGYVMHPNDILYLVGKVTLQIEDPSMPVLVRTRYYGEDASMKVEACAILVNPETGVIELLSQS